MKNIVAATFEDLKTALIKSGKNYDLERITAAYQTAEQAHKGQMRTSGEEYITHPLSVACILVELGMDTDTIMAGLLHDVVEDTSVTLEELTKLYGEDVALMVDGVTKLGRIPFSCLLYTSRCV